MSDAAEAGLAFGSPGLAAALAPLVGCGVALLALLAVDVLGAVLLPVVCCGLAPAGALRAALPLLPLPAARALLLPPVATLGAVLPLLAAAMCVSPCGVTAAVVLLPVAAWVEFGCVVTGLPEFWLCQSFPAEAIGAGLAVGGGFAGAIGVSGAVVVASSMSSNDCESVSGAVAAACDHCDCKNADVELTSDAILGTAQPFRARRWRLACNRRASASHGIISLNSMC